VMGLPANEIAPEPLLNVMPRTENPETKLFVSEALEVF